MFTERFIKVPVNLYDKKQADMIGYSEATKGENVYMNLLPLEISHYRKAADDNDELQETLIHMKNSDSFIASITIEEFENLLNHF